MDRELLVSGLERIGIPFSDHVLDSIGTYIDEIMLFNPVYKLVGDKGYISKGLFEKLFVDGYSFSPRSGAT